MVSKDMSKLVRKKIREISYKKETQGENLRTTIDIEAQNSHKNFLKIKLDPFVLWIFIVAK